MQKNSPFSRNASFIVSCIAILLLLLERKKNDDIKPKCLAVPFSIFSNPKTSYRENLGMFVEEKACLEGRKVKVLEIGVWRGDFALQILDRYHSIIAEYVMIEPAEKLTGAMTPELEQRLKKFPVWFPGTKFKLINEISVEASFSFSNEYFDWIYIDALHTHEGVRDDIQHYWPKLKIGGLFSGHDFTSKLSSEADLILAPWSGRREGREKAGFPGSYRAVIMHSRLVASPVYYTLEGRYGEQMFNLKDTSTHFRNNPSWFMFKSFGEGLSGAKNFNFTIEEGVFSRVISSK